MDLRSQAFHRLLQVHRGQTSAKAWSSNAAGAPKTAMIPSPVNLSTVPPYRCTTAAETVYQFGHDSSQPFGPERSGDVHGMHHVSE